MTYKLETKIEKDILFVEITGIRSQKNVVGVVRDVFKLCVEKSIPKVFVDVEQFEGQLSSLDFIAVIVAVFQDVQDKPFPRLAAVFDPSKKKSKFQFIKNIILSRQDHLSIFNSKKKAIKWIKKK